MANESPIPLYDALRRTKRRKLVGKGQYYFVGMAGYDVFAYCSLVSLSSSEEDSDGDKTPVPSRQTRKQG